MHKIAQRSLGFLLFAILSGCNVSSSQLVRSPVAQRQVENLDAVQSHCFATELIPNQTAWAILLISPECSAPNREDLVEKTFNLGVVSFPYRMVMIDFGVADGAKTNSSFTNDQKWELGVNSVQTLAKALLAEDARRMEAVRSSSNPCIHRTVNAEIFSAGYSCASSNSTKAREAYDSWFLKYCLFPENETKPSPNRDRCTALATEAFQKRVQEELEVKQKALQLLRSAR